MLLVGLVSLGIAAPAIRAAEAGEHLTVEDRELLAWFDTLGIEDFTHAPLIRVRYRVIYTETPKVRHVDEPRAFLLSEKDGRFRVLFGDLTVSSFERFGTDPERDDYVGYRPVSLEEDTVPLLRLLTGKNKDYVWGDGYHSALDQLQITGEAVVLARYCVAAGREDLAAQLLHAAEKHLREQAPVSFREAIQTEFGNAFVWRAKLSVGDPQLDRHTLAGTFRDIARHFPKTNEDEWVTKTAESLEQMATEDATHRVPSEEEYARLAPVDQARELIFQLRDDSIDASDDWPRPLPFPVPPSNGAFRKLVALGLPAVPALLEARRLAYPTRSVSRTRSCATGAFFTTVQGFAERALCQIAGVDFDFLVPRLEDQTWEQYGKQVHLLEDDWWKTTQEQGDAAWLRARILAGSPGLEDCVEALTRRHPELVPEVLMQAIPSNGEFLLRERMIETLAAFDTTEVNAFLRKEMDQELALSTRIVAARVLRRHHRPEALAAMLAEFAALRPMLAQARPDAQSDGPEPACDVMIFLLYTDSALAAREVGATLSHSPHWFREAAIEACLVRMTMAGNSPEIERATVTTRRAVEALLISELHDTTPASHLYGDGGEKLTLADIAAKTLAAGWPTKYRFDYKAAPPARSAQITAIRAAYKPEPAPPETDNDKGR
jgi:hypothetical protein